MQNAPFFEDIAEGPAGGCAYWVHSSDGVRLRLGLWPAQKGAARAGSKAAGAGAGAGSGAGSGAGTILLLPGRTEYIEKYGPVGHDLAAAGYVTLTIDWRGQGLSDRFCDNAMLGHVRDFAEYQLDLAAMLEAAQALGLPQPFFMLSHSMGGCIGLRALLGGLQVQAAAFSAPMWGISLAPALRPFAWVSSWLSHHTGSGCRLAPGTEIETAVLASPYEDNQLTSDRDMYAFMQRQARARPELTLGGPSLGWLYAALSETRALTRMPAPAATPALTCLGTRERIVDPDPVHAHMARWGESGKLVMIEGAEHEVLMETPDRRALFSTAMLELFSAPANA